MLDGVLRGLICSGPGTQACSMPLDVTGSGPGLGGVARIWLRENQKGENKGALRFRLLFRHVHVGRRLM